MIIPKVITSFKNIPPHIIPKIGKKYATVEVLTAPIFSIKYTYPKKARPVDMPPNHNADNKAFEDGISEGKLKTVIGIIINELNTIDHPTKTNLLVEAEYF